MRRKTALLLGLLAVFALAGGIAGSIVGSAAAFGGVSQPAQRSGLAVQENRAARQRDDHRVWPLPAGHTRSSARPLLAVIGASFSAGVGAGPAAPGLRIWLASSTGGSP